MCPDPSCRCGKCQLAPGRNPSEVDYPYATYARPRVHDVLHRSDVPPFDHELLADFHPTGPGPVARWTTTFTLPPRDWWGHTMPLAKVPLRWGMVGARVQVMRPEQVQRNIVAPRSQPWDIDYVIGRR